MKIRKAVLLSVPVALVALALSSAYYFAPANNIQEIDQETLGSEEIQIEDPTPTPTFVPTATPIPVVQNVVPTFTPTPIPQPQTNNEVKQDINGYNSCKQSCPVIKQPDECVNDGASSSCTVGSSNTNQACINSCQSQYGLSF